MSDFCLRSLRHMPNINLSIDRHISLWPIPRRIRSSGSALSSDDPLPSGTSKLTGPQITMRSSNISTSIPHESKKGGAKVVCRDLREGGEVIIDFCLLSVRHLSNISLPVGLRSRLRERSFRRRLSVDGR